MDPKAIRLYRSAKDLPPALWDDLSLRNPSEAAGGAGGTWDGAVHRLTLLGRNYAIDPDGREIRDLDREGRGVSFQAGLVLLVALAKGLDVPPSGRMATPRELPGGAMFFVGPHAVATDRLLDCFREDAKPLMARAELLGGKAYDLGDSGVMVPGLPRIPLYAAVWEGRGEDPARAVVGIDGRAHLHLPLDAVFALTNLFIARLVEG